MTRPTDAVRVRTATPADAGAVADIYAPYVTDTAITFEETAPTAGDFATRIRDTLARDPFLVAEHEGEIVGYAYASPRGARASYRWSIDTAIYVARDRARGGVGRALYSRLLPVLKAQGYAKAYAGIAIPNVPSVAFHESFGFRRIAMLPAVGYKLGAWRDVGWWELPLMARLPDRPAEPVPFPALAVAGPS